jgi:hypothetical protein
LLFAACAASSFGPDSTTLAGDWVWVESSGGIAGWTLSPASEGYEMTLRFSDLVREVELFRDGTSQARTTYAYAFDGDGSARLLFEQPLFGFESARVEIQRGDTLVLVDPCCDGFARRWVR